MLSDNIKILRKKKGYSQETLAEQLHVVRQTISKWEKGISVPDAVMPGFRIMCSRSSTRM